jgi:site-specific recombinase XerD
MNTETRAPNEVAALVGEFTIMLQATNRSPRTIDLYLRGIELFEGFLRERGMPVAVDAIAREHVEAFFAWMMGDGGYAAASAKAYYDGIRQLFRWCEEEGEVAEGLNPMRHVKPPRVIAQPPDILDVDQIRALVRACDGKSFEDRRDAALIRLLYDTGIRLSECAGLTMGDVDLIERREVTVLGKGSAAGGFGAVVGATGQRLLGRLTRCSVRPRLVHETPTPEGPPHPARLAFEGLGGARRAPWAFRGQSAC